MSTAIESLRLEAYRIMGVTREQVMTAVHITPQLRELAKIARREGQPRVTRRIVSGGTDVEIEESTHHAPPFGPGQDLVTSWPYYLKASGAAEAREVLGKWYLLPTPLRRVVSIEACCVAAGLSPIVIVPVLMESVGRLSREIQLFLGAINGPRVVQKHIEMALSDDGVADRTNFLKATGFIPSPKGAQTQIHITQQNANAAPATLAPPPEQTIRALVDRWNNSKKLPAPTTEFIEISDPNPNPEPVTFLSTEVEEESDEQGDPE